MNAALFGAVIGLFAFEASFGIALANPRYIDWLLYGEDATVHFLGWHMYRHGGWALPIGATPSFLYPYGTSVGLTDSIPIFAFLAKAVDPLQGVDWQYVGLWILTSWVLQGVFGALLVGTMTSSVWLQTLGAALFVLSPPLLVRFGHAALSAHWLLLAALWVSFAPWARESVVRATLVWLALITVTSLTHPYLAAMVLAVCAAFHARAALERRSAWLTEGVLPLAGLTMWSAFALWQAGYFVRGSGIGGELGLGEYSMNLLSPLMPDKGSAVFGAGPFAPMTSGQFEGYAYVGAGVMMLALVAALALAIAGRQRRLARALVSHAPLGIVCAAFVVFAVGPRVSAGTQLLFEYPAALWGPLAVFRASGRFVWVPYYALVAAIIAVVVRTLSVRLAVAIVTVAVLVQAYDMNVWYRGARGLRAVRWHGPLYSTFWSDASQHYKHLTLWPTNMCDASGLAIDYVPFALVAGRAGLTLNAGFEARQNLPHFADYCRSFQARRTRGEVADDELYVMRPAFRPGFETRALQPVTCLDVDGYSVCMTTRSYETWHGRSPRP
jgi:hypothetical protein